MVMIEIENIKKFMAGFLGGNLFDDFLMSEGKLSMNISYEFDGKILKEFYELGCPERAGDLAFGTTMIHPGKIGNEYYMTKGHFHQIVDTAEVYYTLKGEGYMMLENLDGDWRVERMEKGKALYVPRGYAHRTINTGDEVLTAFYVFDADAGHDYGTIETKGYRHIVCEINGEVTVLDNPRW